MISTLMVVGDGDGGGNGDVVNKSAWRWGADFVDSLLKPGHGCVSALTPEEIKSMREIRGLLMSKAVEEDNVPEKLSPRQCNCKKDDGGGGGRGRGRSDLNKREESVNRFIAEEYGGEPESKTFRSRNFRSAALSVRNSLTLINITQATISFRQNNLRCLDSEEGGKNFLPLEWFNLSPERQLSVFHLLSYDKLSQWEYDALDTAAACGESHTLLFVGWAILAAPYAQRAMAKHLGRDELTLGVGDVYNFVDTFHVKPEVLCNFLRVVEGEYVKENPYHNNIHGADVLQTTFSLLRMGGDRYASNKDLELYSFLVAAACHDIGHPGRNNAFLINTRADLAVVYNDRSVLENMHASHAIRLLTSTSFKGMNLDILAGMSDPIKKTFRTQLVHAILATDMSGHFSLVAKMKSLIEMHGVDNVGIFYGAGGGLWGCSKDLSLALHFILHQADISAQAKTEKTCAAWGDKVIDEFFLQGDEERDLGLPISLMCDRYTTVKSDTQIGFLNYVVQPSFSVLSDMIPDTVTTILPNIKKNLNYWEIKLEQAGFASLSTADDATT